MSHTTHNTFYDARIKQSKKTKSANTHGFTTGEAGAKRMITISNFKHPQTEGSSSHASVSRHRWRVLQLYWKNLLKYIAGIISTYRAINFYDFICKSPCNFLLSCWKIFSNVFMCETCMSNRKNLNEAFMTREYIYLKHRYRENLIHTYEYIYIDSIEKQRGIYSELEIRQI